MTLLLRWLGKVDWTIVVICLGVPVLLGMLYYEGYEQGKNAEHAEWVKEKAQMVLAVQALEKKAAEVTTKVVVKYVERKAEVKVKNQVIKQEVIRYVQSKPKSCSLDSQWVLLHDNAATNTVSKASRGNHETPSATALVTVTENYGTCHETREQLLACQSWIREQEANSE